MLWLSSEENMAHLHLFRAHQVQSAAGRECDFLTTEMAMMSDDKHNKHLDVYDYNGTREDSIMETNEIPDGNTRNTLCDKGKINVINGGMDWEADRRNRYPEVDVEAAFVLVSLRKLKQDLLVSPKLSYLPKLQILTSLLSISSLVSFRCTLCVGKNPPA